MNSKQIEEKLKTAVSHAAPDVLEDILSRCQTEKGTVVPMNYTSTDNSSHVPKRNSKRFAAIGIAAAVVFAAGVFAGPRISLMFSAVESVVAIDVNPSVQLKLNSKEKVLEASALNEDADDILNGMNLKGIDLDVAVNALIGSMLRHGYIDELANSVLISVESSDSAKGEVLSQRLTEEVCALLESNSISGAVLSQTISGENELLQTASQNHISPGKAALIQKILNLKPLLKFEDLAALSINDLNLLIASIQREAHQDVSLTVSGSASEKAYIGLDQAKTIAYAHSGVSDESTVLLEGELDWENGRMVYELEFVSGSTEYEYDIDALTGDILKYKSDLARTHTLTASSAVQSNWIGESRAKQIAFEDAGVSEAAVSRLELDFDYENGVGIYEIDFDCGSDEYEYEIVAVSGEILERKTKTGERAASQTSGDISLEKVKEIAFSDVGISASSVYDLEIDYDYDHGAKIYEIEFDCDGVEYEYKISAASGEILKRKTDKGKNQTVSVGAAVSEEGVSSEQAKQIAYDHAGVAASQIYELKTEYEWDDGIPLYKVEFKADGMEYEYKIHALTGTVLKYEKERD